MKTLKTFLLGLATLFATIVVAQSVSPGYPLTTDIHGGYGHTIFVESFTFKANVDLGGQFALYRTVEIDQFGSWSDYEQVDSLGQTISSDGIDEFTVRSADIYFLRVHYRYLQNGDGYSIGDDAVTPIEVGPIQVKLPLGLAVTYMEVNGAYLDVQVETRRHVVPATPFDAELVLEVRNMDFGNVIWYDSTAINPVGSPFMTRSYQIYLFQPAPLCVTARVRYSHDGPGYSDFTGVLVGTTAGNNCVNWDFNTGGAEEEKQEIVISLIQNEIVVSGAPVGSSVSVCDLTGRQIMSTALFTSRIGTESWTSGVYLVTVVDETSGRKVTKRLVID